MTPEQIEKYIESKAFNDWLVCKDCYGTRMVDDWEKPLITIRLQELLKGDIKITTGDLQTDQPNNVIVDITHLAPNLHAHEVLINFSHFIRPCPCDTCDHKYQYECYIEDCDCCTSECT